VTWTTQANHGALAIELSRAFETDASGLHLCISGTAISQSYDRQCTPVRQQHSGLEPGDEILAVDEVSGLPLWKVSEALRKAELPSTHGPEEGKLF